MLLRITSSFYPRTRSITRRTLATRPNLTTTNLNAKPGETPAIIPGTSGNFAMQFFEKAYENGGDEGVKRFEKELDVLTWSVRKDADWEVVTRSPLVNKEWRNQLVHERLQSIGCSQFFINCILDLIDRRVISRLDQVRVDYEEIMRAYRREVDVTFVTGKSIQSSDLEYFKKSIKLNYLRPEDNVIFTHTVDPNIKKGYIVTIGQNTYDFTWNKAIEAENARTQEQNRKEEIALLSQYPANPDLKIKETLLKLLEKGEWLPTDTFKNFIE